MTRYRLLSMPLRRVLAWRQLAVLLLAGVCALLGAVTIAVTAGIALPVNGGSRWTYAAVLAYALATLGFSAIPASRVAVRYPLPRKRRAWAAAGEAAGPAAMVYWVMIAAVAVVVVDVSAFVAGGMVMRRVAPQLPATPWTAVVAAAIVAAISILATVKGWHAPEGSSV